MTFDTQQELLTEQYFDRLLDAPAAEPPAGLDKATAATVQSLMVLQADVHVGLAQRQRIWAQALRRKVAVSLETSTTMTDLSILPTALPPRSPATGGHTRWGALLAAGLLLFALGLFAVPRLSQLTALSQPTSEALSPVTPTPASFALSEAVMAVPVLMVNEQPLAVGAQMDGLDAVALSQMRMAGISWLKWSLRYTPAQEAVLLDIGTAYIDWAHEQQMQALIQIVGDPRELFTGEGSYVDAYAAFAAALAARGADALEIWQEPNIDRNWQEGSIGGAEYNALLRPVFDAIRAASPETKVISAAPAPTQAQAEFPTRIKNDDQWLREFVAAGGLGYADCVGMHYVEGVLPPSASSGDPRGEGYSRYLTAMLSRYREIVGGQEPLCITSLGYLAGESEALPDGFGWAATTSRDEQAAWIAEAVRVIGETSGIELSILWNINFAGGDIIDRGYGLLLPDGSCPTCALLSEMTTLVFSETTVQPASVIEVATIDPTLLGEAASIDLMVGAGSSYPLAQTLPADQLCTIRLPASPQQALYQQPNSVTAPSLVDNAMGDLLFEVYTALAPAHAQERVWWYYVAVRVGDTRYLGWIAAEAPEVVSGECVPAEGE
jgi:hypothetical protein